MVPPWGYSDVIVLFCPIFLHKDKSRRPEAQKGFAITKVLDVNSPDFAFFRVPISKKAVLDTVPVAEFTQSFVCVCRKLFILARPVCSSRESSL